MRLATYRTESCGVGRTSENAVKAKFAEGRLEEVQSRVSSMMRKLRSLLSETPFGGERIVADLYSTLR